MTLVTNESAKSESGKNVIKPLIARERFHKIEIRFSKSKLPYNVDLIKELDNKATKQ